MVEVELVQTAQETTSQADSSVGNQEPAGGKLSSARKTQGEGHDTPDSDSGDTQGSDNEGGDNEAPPVHPDAQNAPGGGGGNGRKGRHGKGKLIGKQPAKKGQKGILSWEPASEVPQPTALRPPPAREVSTIEAWSAKLRPWR